MQLPNISAVLGEVTTMFRPDVDVAMPPEAGHVLGTLAQLPEGEYAYLDPELDGVPDHVYGYEVRPAWSWDGEQPESQGYGDCGWVATPHGLGVYANLGGSEAASAATIYVVPAACVAE